MHSPKPLSVPEHCRRISSRAAQSACRWGLATAHSFGSASAWTARCSIHIVLNVFSLYDCCCWYWSVEVMELRHCVNLNTSDDGTGGSMLIECSWSFDYSHESCYRSDSSWSTESMNSFREEIDLIFGENWNNCKVKFRSQSFFYQLFIFEIQLQ